MPSLPRVSPERAAVADAHKALAASKQRKASTATARIQAGRAVAGNRKMRSGKPSTAKHVVGGAAAGASTGATIGSIVPGIGNAVGGTVGGVVGGIGGVVSGRRAKENFRAEQSVGGYKKILIGEFVVCLVITALSPLTDKHKKDSPADMMKRMSAVAVLFIILGLVGGGGRSAGKMAAGFGGIVTLVLLLSERDVLTVLAEKFSTPGKSGPTGPGPTREQIQEVSAPGVGIPDRGVTPPGVPDRGIAPPGASGDGRTRIAGRIRIDDLRNRLAPEGGVWI